MDSQDSQPISKPKPRNLSEYINSPEGREATRKEIERQEAMPSKAFPADSEPGAKVPTLRDYFQSEEFKKDWREQIRRQNEAPSKAFPTDSQEA